MLKTAWIAGLLATGMGAALLGSVKVSLAKRLTIDEGKIGGLVSMFGFAVIPVMLVMGFLTDMLDKRAVMIAGSALMTVSLVLLSRASGYRAVLIATLFLSAGWSASINVLNVLMQSTFGGSATHAMNLGNFFFGLGAFLTPLFVAFLFKNVGWAKTMLALAVLAALHGLFALNVTLAPAEPALSPQGAAGVEAILVDPIFWLCALALLFYAPMEATMGAWATTYLGEKGVSDKAAAGLLSGFWLAFTMSRLGAALIVGAYPLTAGGTNLLIVGLSLFCVLVWACVAFSSGRTTACAAVILAGLVFGPTFPTIIGVLTAHIDPALAGRAVGLFFMVGGIGWSVIPILIGARARRTGIQGAFRLAVVAAAGLLVTAIALKLFMQ